MLAKTTTDLSGFYTFTVTPTSAGTIYYYLFDSQASAGHEWRYVGKLDVVSMNTAFKPLTTTLANVEKQGLTTQQSVQQLQSSNLQLQQTINTLSGQVSGLQSSLTNANYIAIGAIIVALIAIVLTFLRTKK